MTFSTTIALQGIFLGFSLIIPIGTQNMYVLRQGVLGKHPYATALVCALCDTLLICTGAMGLGSIIASHVLLRRIAVTGGVIFLSYYGVKSAYRALHKSANQSSLDTFSQPANLKMVVATALAFSLLNPHAILDTTVLIGGLAAQYTILAERLSFTLGAVIASWLWFFGLAKFATFLKPIFHHALAARILDGIVAIIMFAIAAMLAYAELL